MRALALITIRITALPLPFLAAHTPRLSTTHSKVSCKFVTVAVSDKLFHAIIIANAVAVDSDANAYANDITDANAYANDITTNSIADANAIQDSMAVKHPDAHSVAVT